MNFYKFLNQFNTKKRISKFLFIMLKYDSESKTFPCIEFKTLI